MVVFICETCQETIKKNQVDKHCGRCRNAWHFTCIECGKTFGGFEFKEHNECMTEK
jgi:cell growth-regulating nucleolar protein